MTWSLNSLRGRAAVAGVALSLIAGPALAGGASVRFAAIMDQVFGPGAWRMTGGYRTPERENELRAQGAMTVRPGGVSRHSLGSHAAPGAYDLVVDGMSPYEAAARLRRAGAPFARYQPKGAHGTQGAHLHMEPYSFDLLATGPTGEIVGGGVDSGLPVVLAGFRRPARAEVAAAPDLSEPDEAPATTPAGRALARLRADAMDDKPAAQLALGRAYAEGLDAPRDLRAARAWLELAAGNPKASGETYEAAKAALREVADQLDIDGELQTRRAKRQAASVVAQASCPAPAPRAGRGPIVVAMGADCGPAPKRGEAAIVVMSGR